MTSGKRRLDEFLERLRNCEDPRGMHVEDLARQLGVSRKTIYSYRDQATNYYDIWIDNSESSDQVPRGYLKLSKDAPDLRHVTLNSAEVEALLTAAARVESLTPLARHALDKLQESKRFLPGLETRPTLYTPLADSYPDALFERITRAIRDRRTVTLSYLNAQGDSKTYLFDPYILVARDPHLYLVGANHNSRAAGFDPIKLLRLDQVQVLTLQKDYFADPGFDAAAYCRAHFGAFAGEGELVTVRVCFSPEKAGYIRRTLRHPSQQVHDQENGSVVWQVEVTLADDLVHWISSYGPHATVLEPDLLRKQVVAWAKGTLAANDPAPQATPRARGSRCCRLGLHPMPATRLPGSRGGLERSG